MKRVIAAAMVLGGTLLGQSAMAAPSIQKFKDWELRCADPGNGIEQCAMVQAFMSADGKRPIGAILIAKSPDGKQVAADVTVPLGVALPAGLQFRVDTTKANAYPFLLCEPKGCHAQIPIDAAMLAKLKKGSKASIAMANIRKEIATGTLSLRGFTAAFNNLK